jgi:hypothetical protein
VAENVRPPVAIRIVRPYETEDQLLEHELETVGKTSVVLIGAHPRPTGVILRFEVTLASGATVLRGEGRVLAHKENAFRGQPGLTLRFTRLDPRSKSVVDRATAIREARAQTEGSAGGTPSRPVPRAEGALADALTASTPAPAPAVPNPSTAPSAAPSPSAMNADQEAAVASVRASAREKANANARANARRTGSGRPSALTPPPIPVNAPETAPPPTDVDDAPTPVPTPVTSVPGEVEEAPTYADTRSSPPIAASPIEASPVAAVPRVVARAPRMDTPAPIQAPPDRAELLARLRERAGNLPPERVQEILAARR